VRGVYFAPFGEIEKKGGVTMSQHLEPLREEALQDIAFHLLPAPDRTEKKGGVTMSKKGGNDEHNFFETLVNTGFLAPLQTLI